MLDAGINQLQEEKAKGQEERGNAESSSYRLFSGLLCSISAMVMHLFICGWRLVGFL